MQNIVMFFKSKHLRIATMALGSVFPQRGKELKYYLMCITIRQEFHQIILYECNLTVLKINAIVEVFRFLGL